MSSEGNLILHCKPYNSTTGRREWLQFNDFAVRHIAGGVDEVCDFRMRWRTPCILMFEMRSALQHKNLTKPANLRIPDLVFQSPSLSRSRSVGCSPASFTPLTASTMLGAKDLAAIDCEFVAISAEESSISFDGRRTVVKPAQLALARISMVREDGVPFMDDYIVRTETVLDYLTRFSGIVPGDLDPVSSPHHLVSLKTAYLKLRYLVDKGVIFVGHGLSKDFRMVNIHVPENQIVDTVHLYHLPGQRLIGLRFLIRYFFGVEEGIQDASRGHDSIEDAVGALRLYRKYQELKATGHMRRTINDLYAYGHDVGWKN